MCATNAHGPELQLSWFLVLCWKFILMCHVLFSTSCVCLFSHPFPKYTNVIVGLSCLLHLVCSCGGFSVITCCFHYRSCVLVCLQVCISLSFFPWTFFYLPFIVCFWISDHHWGSLDTLAQPACLCVCVWVFFLTKCDKYSLTLYP